VRTVELAVPSSPRSLASTSTTPCTSDCATTLVCSRSRERKRERERSPYPRIVAYVRACVAVGEENFEFLSKHDILLFDGSNIKYVVAAAIVAIEGLHQTAIALARYELPP